MLTNKFNGIQVAWHFDSRFFDYQGETWEIISTRNGTDRTLINSVHTIKRQKDGVSRDIRHGELVEMILNERRYMEKKKLSTATA